MNDMEIKIIKSLRKNARLKLTAMSRETKIPVSTIFDKLKSLQGTLISKFTALLCLEKMGFYSAMIAIKVASKDKESIQKTLLKNNNVNNLLKINNGYDFLFELIFSTIRDMEAFLESLDLSFSIKKKEVYYVLDDLKRETFLAGLSYQDEMVPLPFSN